MPIIAVPILVAARIICVPTEITQSEAKSLVLHAEAALAKGAELGAEPSEPFGRPNSWTFRVFAEHPNPTDTSNLMGWYSVNKWSAALTDPVLDDRPITIPAVKGEQKRLQKAHCLKPQP